MATPMYSPVSPLDSSLLLESDTLKVGEFRPRSCSDGLTIQRDFCGQEQLMIVNKMTKITLTECGGSGEVTKTETNNNNNLLKCPAFKKLTLSKSNPYLGDVVKKKAASRLPDRELFSRPTVLKLHDITPPDQDVIRRSVTPVKISPEAQSIIDMF